MIRRSVWFPTLAGVFLASSAGALSQPASSAIPPVVNESADRAILGKDAIQLRLPLTNQAVRQIRVIAWILSPTGVPSGETSMDLAPGVYAANFTLPLPKDQHGAHIQDIGWYRIAYRVESVGSPPAQGILSIGAIAANLLDLRLASPANPIACVPLSVRIHAGNAPRRSGSATGRGRRPRCTWKAAR